MLRDVSFVARPPLLENGGEFHPGFKLDRYPNLLPLVKERTRWVWNVTPMKSGDLTLTVTLTAPVLVNGRKTGYEITSF
jgi:hypothetical protein